MARFRSPRLRIYICLSLLFMLLLAVDLRVFFFRLFLYFKCLPCFIHLPSLLGFQGLEFYRIVYICPAQLKKNSQLSFSYGFVVLEYTAAILRETKKVSCSRCEKLICFICLPHGSFCLGKFFVVVYFERNPKGSSLQP